MLNTASKARNNFFINNLSFKMNLTQYLS
jgi:hypothetical protein